MSVKNLGYFLAVAGAATFATRDVISRHVLTGISPPLVAAGFALLIGGAMLLVIIHRQCPTVLIHCLLSDLMGADIAAKTQNAIPNCELVQLDSGHLPHLERPDEFIRVMNAFLKD